MSIDNQELQKELDQIIRKLTKCMLLYINNLENINDMDRSNSASNILNKVSSTLTKLLKARGIRLESDDNLAALLARLEVVRDDEEAKREEDT